MIYINLNISQSMQLIFWYRHYIF